MRVVAIFGPTASGKTAVAIALAERLRERGEDPVAVSCDAIQVYRGLELISGAPGPEQTAALEHRLLGIAAPSEEFSVGRFAELARAEIDELLAGDRRPIIVGGTGLYMRAALADLDLRPPVDAGLREQLEAEVEDRGSQALHAQLPEDVRGQIHPNDRKRVMRALELLRSGEDPAERSNELWSSKLRHPTLSVGLVCGSEQLERRIGRRVEEMAAAGAGAEAEAADAAGASRTARAALGFDAFLRGDLEAVKTAHRRYAKRQMTWLRKMPAIELVDRSGRDDAWAAEQILALLGDTAA